MRDGASPLIFASSPILIHHPEKSIDLKVDFKPKVIERPSAPCDLVVMAFVSKRRLIQQRTLNCLPEGLHAINSRP
ncbi:hypothetical protein EMIT0P2_10598 [Pseudomonas sp. IT-P2]